MLTLRKIAIWLSKSCQKLEILLKKNENFCQFFEKNVKFLAIFWQSNGNFPEGQHPLYLIVNWESMFMHVHGIFMLTNKTTHEWQCQSLPTLPVSSASDVILIRSTWRHSDDEPSYLVNTCNPQVKCTQHLPFFHNTRRAGHIILYQCYLDTLDSTK